MFSYNAERIEVEKPKTKANAPAADVETRLFAQTPLG
jgi:hypothetical protein